MSLFAVYRYKTNEMHVYIIKLYKDIQFQVGCRVSRIFQRTRQFVSTFVICDIFINRKRNTFNLFDHVNTFY